MIPLQTFHQEYNLAQERKELRLMQAKSKEMQDRASVTPKDLDGHGKRMDKAKKFVIQKLNEYEKLSKKRKQSAQR